MTILKPVPAARPAALSPAYATADKAKLKRNRQSNEAYRETDQAEWDRAHEQRVTAAVTWAEYKSVCGGRTSAS